MQNDDEKWHIPELYRVSLDASDETAYQNLLNADIEQAKLAEIMNSPFLDHTPLERERAKAFITLEMLLKTASMQELTDEQTEMLAQAYACIGRYDKAANTTHLHTDHYRQYWGAIFKPDLSWCAHNYNAAYIKEYIYSFKHECEMPMMCCNICGFLNARNAPATVAALNDSTHRLSGKTAGMTIDQALAYHQHNVSKQ